ncbi:Trehalose-6-P synthase/phosphatase complex subunit [Friedmanniomyces endolithicus]|uniref:Trehalose-6-P synthase/phosphatase complex subunit n=1 Tax=Friedmanniomyces endolithicus TaxID=329885 RepID=A0AAN6KBM4_9PEZI|nr:Trehalose-6-P synthase/phosphatase complex subunit [Friedmanniomyces endolithicus]KAK0798901.1 Trehalose-6-P synthase/phosphatase complex subunit [Friedmanniomyces endolithicus]KAK0803425.1 Trehalose-6-P synthase/phosphatase complex subunit [Friedmanniomyces endolithicus]KAK0849990.1 Trehalose-6-P synthase/phosphatase complex subunit [Friedmanniomyces endolithicus]KAK0905073.1 Trehalose-6-P synthase/phosphatase complex subunit [Friedmanniomyces endolithicus]
MATHHVSLFLPETVAFHKPPSSAARRSSTPPPTADLRRGSSVDLPLRPPSLSILNGPTPPRTPSITDDIFASKPGTDKLLSREPGDPRSLVHSDAHVPDWGVQAIFNQPKSRAGLLPSASILDFAKVHEEVVKEREEARRAATKRISPTSRSSRAGSHDRSYEGKEWTVKPAIQGNGGLTNAVRAVAESDETEIHWIGTIGFPTDTLPQALKEDIHDKMVIDHNSQVIFVSDKDFDGHYAHYCKTILWPIFHYQVPDHPKSKAYADHSWEFYRNVNQAFADKIIDSYKRGDTIWIHDYHLLLVPAMVRQKLPDAKIGFFLHTAFPSSEVFRCLSTRKALLDGMLGANLIAFQTDEYTHHFLQTCSRLLTVETTAEGVQLDDHFVNVTSQPIGLNLRAMDKERKEPEVQEWIDIIQERYKDKKIIVARDKLDNVRGVRQKLLAYELFLNKHPEWREKVVLIQVASSSSEQSGLLSTVSDICTRIDSVHSTLAHQPLIFLKQDIGFSQYMALLTVADVLIISALRDGMNLTAHEYIYCQDGKGWTGREKRHGPLILSEFTGSAAVFGGPQISINPWDYQQHANAIKEALEMGDAEKTARWTKLHKTVTTQTGGHWAHHLSLALDKVYNEHSQRASQSVPRLSVQRLADKYRAAAQRVFVLDYEGTLAPHRTSTGIPLSSPQRVLDALEGLMADARNIVYIMSGREPEELEALFRTLPALGLIAENGCFVREYGGGGRGEAHAEWQQFPDADGVAVWKDQVRGNLGYYGDRLEGSYVEERHCSLLFRYEKAGDQEAAVRFAGEAADQINSACRSMRIHAVPISKAVLIEQMDFSKRSAASRIFDFLRAGAIEAGTVVPEFLLVAGDDREDEVVFEWANGLATNGVVRDVFTVSVGRRNTVACATLTQGATGLLTALQRLGRTGGGGGVEGEYFGRGRGAATSPGE